MKKILIGGLLGGLAIFIGSFITHMVLPTGEMGVEKLPNEDVILTTLKESIPQSGFYFFPGMDMNRDVSPEEQKAWEEKYTAGPIGILIYHPNGRAPMSAGYLLVELGSDLVAGLIGAMILSLVTGAYFKRVLIVALFGLLAWLPLSISYWNWYGYPGIYILAEGFDQVFSWGLGGLTMAAFIKGRIS